MHKSHKGSLKRNLCYQEPRLLSTFLRQVRATCPKCPQPTHTPCPMSPQVLWGVLFFIQCPTSTLVRTWWNKVVFRLVLPVLDLLSLNVEPLGQLVVFFFWPHHTACRVLVPWSGIEPVPPAVRVRSLNHWTAGKSFLYFFWSYFLLSNTMVLELVR